MTTNVVNTRLAAGLPRNGIFLIVGNRASSVSICYLGRNWNGPVAQLGARFHGMEEVESSNLSRSTNHLFALIQLFFEICRPNDYARVRKQPAFKSRALRSPAW